MHWTAVNREMFKSNAVHLLPCCMRSHQTQTWFQRELTLWQLLDGRTSRSRLPAPVARPQSAPDWAGTTGSKGGQRVLQIASYFIPSRVIKIVGQRKENDPSRATWSLGLQMNPLPAAAPRWFRSSSWNAFDSRQTQQYLRLLLLRCPWNWTTLSEFPRCLRKWYDVISQGGCENSEVESQLVTVVSLTCRWNVENS